MTIEYASGRIERTDVFTGIVDRPPEAPADAKNILVLGSDTREGLTRQQRRRLSTGRDECNCSDTMMLVHLDSASSGAAVVSFPRDLMVTVPAHTDASGRRHPAELRQINSAYSLGGPQLVVRTVEKLTGVRIDHYVQVRFSGVVEVVDALKGVEVCVPKSFSDTRTRLALDAGMHELDGIDALKYLRLRYVGTGSDLDRIQRQQQFLVNALSRATASNLLTDPRKAKRLLDATTDSLVVDKGMGPDDIVALGRRLSQADREQIVLLTVPNQPWRVDRNRVEVERPAADRVFGALRSEDAAGALAGVNASTSMRRKDVSVRVLNATSRVGLAARATRELAAAGFVIGRSPGNRSSGDPGRTEVRYGSGAVEAARTVAAVVPGAVLVETGGSDEVVTVVLGTDYSGLRLRKPRTARSANQFTAARDACDVGV